jgi:hypothetical protein
VTKRGGFVQYGGMGVRTIGAMIAEHAGARNKRANRKFAKVHLILRFVLEWLVAHFSGATFTGLSRPSPIIS